MYKLRITILFFYFFIVINNWEKKQQRRGNEFAILQLKFEKNELQRMDYVKAGHKIVAWGELQKQK